MKAPNNFGIYCILLSTIFSALMGAAFFAAHQADPLFSSSTGSFVRTLANCGFLFVPFALWRQSPQVLHPFRHPHLWSWGLFGGLTVTTFFAAVSLVGNGKAAFLSGISGVLIAVLAPWLARQPTSFIHMLSAGGLCCRCLFALLSFPRRIYVEGLLNGFGLGYFRCSGLPDAGSDTY